MELCVCGHFSEYHKDGKENCLFVTERPFNVFKDTVRVVDTCACIKMTPIPAITSDLVQ